MSREVVKCNLNANLRAFWKVPMEGDIIGELLYVGQESDDEYPYVCAYVILEDGKVIGVEPNNLRFLKGIQGLKIPADNKTFANRFLAQLRANVSGYTEGKEDYYVDSTVVAVLEGMFDE